MLNLRHTSKGEKREARKAYWSKKRARVNQKAECCGHLEMNNNKNSTEIQCQVKNKCLWRERK